MIEVPQTPELIEAEFRNLAADLIGEFSPQIWEFYYTNSRSVYFLDESDLRDDASEEVKASIREREVPITDEQAEVLFFYTAKARDHLAEQIVTDHELGDLLILQGIHQKSSLVIGLYPRVALGLLQQGVQSEATIQVPLKYEPLLNLRGAISTIENGIITRREEGKDVDSTTAKIPAVIALSYVADFFDKDSEVKTETGSYL